jgi:ADP-heptose:LPS heptosyltransferase
MTAVLPRLPEGARVAIVRLRSLGDCVLTTPAIALLKAARPDLRLAVVVEPRFAAVYSGNPDLAAVLPPSHAALLGWRPRLTLNLHGGGRSAALTASSLARWRAGYAHFRHRWLYNIRIPRAQQILGEERTVHTAEHAASAMFYLGVPRAEIPRARLYCDPPAPGPPYAVLHPMASAPDKTWPADRFLEIAAALARRGIEPVFIGGPGEDLRPFSAYRSLAARPLEELKRLLCGATLFAGNDSGPAHMAAAFGLPVVVLFGSSNPVIWAPWRTRAEVITAPVLKEVPAARVLEALDRLLVPA